MMGLLLDTNVLIRLCHPKNQPELLRWFDEWMARAAHSNAVQVYLSPVAEYEAKRGYLYKLHKSDSNNDSLLALARLNKLRELMPRAQLDDAAWRRAANLWAEARLNGYQTAPDHHIDWDVIIASQALELDAVVVTSNANFRRIW